MRESSQATLVEDRNPAPGSPAGMNCAEATLARMEHALGVLSEAICWTDAEGMLLWCNRAFERLAMLRAASLIGQPVEKVLVLRRDGKLLTQPEHPVRKALGGQQPVVGAALIDTYQTERGGQIRYLEIYVACRQSANETSATMVIRDNTERHLAEAWLEAESKRSELIRQVAAASNQAESPGAALEAVLPLLCQFLGWPLGRAIFLQSQPSTPAANLWHIGAKMVHLAAFMAAAESAGGFHQVAALAAEPGKPVWLAGISAQPESAMVKAAIASELRTCVALPISALGETCAVVELYSCRLLAADEDLMPLLEQIAAQLGRVFEREQSRMSLVRAKEDLERRVEERTSELSGLNAVLHSEIVSREKFQLQLRESMDRYRSLVQSVRDVIFSLSASGRVESMNSAFETLTGIPARTMVARRLSTLIHPEDRKAAADAFRLTLRGTEVPPFDLRLHHTSGAWVTVECSLTHHSSPGKGSRGVTGSARDVTENRRARAELIVRDRAIAATSEGIMITDPGQPGNPITFVNSGFERLTGCRASEAVGRGLDMLEATGTSSDALEQLQEAFTTGNPATVEMLVSRCYAQPFWGRLAITPVRDDRGKLVNFVGVLFDITHQKEAERLKNDLVSTVSHELRTPLTSMRGFAELMLEREYPPEKQKKFIQIIHRESSRLSNLINDFLDVQRMESGRQDYAFSRARLAQVLNDTAAMFRPTSQVHEFVVNCPDQLPDVRADVDRLRQVVTNLISNAVKFSPRGGAVTVEASLEGPMIQVMVADEGIGIPPEGMARLFEKFYRVDNTETRKIGGTGLGLSIVKQIVEAHGGRVWVESKAGEGTRFFLTLPVFA